MSHFHFKAVFVQDHQGLFQGGPHFAVGPLPVLLLQHLGGKQLLPVAFVVRRFDPEFQLRGAGDDQLLDVLRAVDAFDVLKDVRVLLQLLEQLALKVVQGVSENDPGAYLEMIVVDQERRYPQGTRPGRPVLKPMLRKL